MANKLYVRLRKITGKLTTKLGKTAVTLYAPGMVDENDPSGGYDENENNWPRATVHAVETQFLKKEVDGERIRASDIQLILAADDPGIGSLDLHKVSKCDIKGVRYDCMLLNSIEPGDEVLAYIMRAR